MSTAVAGKSLAALPPLPNLLLRSVVTLALLYGILATALTVLVAKGRLEPLVAVVLGVVVVAVQFLLAPWFMDLTLRWFNSLSWVDPSELPDHLRVFVERVADQEGLAFPSFGIIDDGSPQAFTYGRRPGDARVVISRGLMELLTPAELEAVVAHELGHVRNWDMVLMTVASFVPMVLYRCYRICARLGRLRGKRSSSSRMRTVQGGAAAVAIACYLLYLISEYLVLWFSRTREYAADRFAGTVTGDANTLSSALVKIAYGLAASDSQQKKEDAAALADDDPDNDPLARSAERAGLSAMNIFDRTGAIGLVMAAKGKEPGTVHDPHRVDLGRIQGAMQWDLWNPWARWYELHSTHPLTANRLLYLSSQADQQGHLPLVTFDREQPESYWDEFAVDALMMALPSLGLVAWLAAFAVSVASTAIQGQGSAVVKPHYWMVAAGFVLYGIGGLIATRFSYAFGGFEPTRVADLLEQVKVSAIRPVPAEITGTIIGRGVPGLVWSEDFVVRDSTGILFLDYRQPLGIWNFFFGLLRAGNYTGQKVTVRGWYRRAPVPYLEIYEFELTGAESTRRTCYTYHAQMITYVVMTVAAAVFAVVSLLK